MLSFSRTWIMIEGSYFHKFNGKIITNKKPGKKGTGMIMKRWASFTQEMSFRLSVWYAIILLIVFTGSFMIFSPLAARNLERRLERELRNEVNEYVNLFQAHGLQALGEQLDREAGASGTENILQGVVTPQGRNLVTTDTIHWKNFPIQVECLKQAAGQSEPVLTTLAVPGVRYKVKVAYARLAPERILRIAVPLRHEENFLQGLRHILLLIMAIVLGAVLLAGWFFLQHAMGRVVAVTNTAMSISTGTLSQRVPASPGGDEIDRLALAFNGMLDRIEKLVRSQQEVTDNVAHDLKVPLTRIRLLAETLATSPPAKIDLPDLAGTIVEESDRLLEMINTSLEIRAIEAGIAIWDFREMDMAGIIRKTAEIFQIAADGKGVALTLQDTGPAPILGDERRLLRAISNLIDNAIKYTPAGGRVTLSLRPGDETVVFKVRDTGMGMTPDILPRIFERFYRGDDSRSLPGLGLGLSLVQSIVHGHGGTIEVQSSPGKGSTFTITFPRVGSYLKSDARSTMH